MVYFDLLVIYFNNDCISKNWNESRPDEIEFSAKKKKKKKKKTIACSTMTKRNVN